jgi:hypothetical protein
MQLGAGRGHSNPKWRFPDPNAEVKKGIVERNNWDQAKEMQYFLSLLMISSLPMAPPLPGL